MVVLAPTPSVDDSYPGWRELSVGTWLSRMQPREFALLPCGWVRVVSGLQSVLSVYLLAMWFSSEFLRPFG